MGARLPQHDFLMRWIGFQSTRPALGARLSLSWDICRKTAFQSTRPRGARLRFGGRAQTAAPFQSTRPRGARQDRLKYAVVTLVFQSTRPRGARRVAFVPFSVSSDFNPRARVGRDDTAILIARKRRISIHAPRMGGATLFCGLDNYSIAISIHAPRMGARLQSLVQDAAAAKFQSTRPA